MTNLSPVETPTSVDKTGDSIRSQYKSIVLFDLKFESLYSDPCEVCTIFICPVSHSHDSDTFKILQRASAVRRITTIRFISSIHLRNMALNAASHNPSRFPIYLSSNTKQHVQRGNPLDQTRGNQHSCLTKRSLIS